MSDDATTMPAALAQLDQDVQGERRFCQLAASSLRSFQARWTGALDVTDGYSAAIRALDTMLSILATAQSRTAGELLRDARLTVSTEQAEAQAAQTREHALALADIAPA